MVLASAARPSLPPEVDILATLVGTGASFRSAISHLLTFARSSGSILISGETGTGKELVSRAIHLLSPRADHPFVPVNCGALTDTLLEGELFGHERGAFTDAHARQEGILARAAGGTVLLDEVDTLTPRGQVSLLRVIQDGTYRPLGCATEQRVDVRFLGATNAPLDTLVEAGTFRADLYYRLCVFAVRLPPLRDRRDDILSLASHFLTKHALSEEPGPGFSQGSRDALMACDWPGNVRELENAIMRGVHVAVGRAIQPDDMGLRAAENSPSSPATEIEVARTYKAQKGRVLDAFHRDYLTRLMTESRGNVSRAARSSGKERRDLGRLLRRHGIDPRQYLS
jgi:DNA-binding NtrC family response regulator